MDDESKTTGSEAPQPKQGWFDRLLSTVEWLGNCLPHPVSLFAILAGVVVVVSGLATYFGLSVQDPRPLPEGVDPADHVITSVSLLNADGLRWVMQSLVTNYTQFVPLGTVLVAMLGVGVAEKSGLLGAGIRGLVLTAPKNLVTMVVVFAGILSNTASEMGYVVLIPLAAAIFHTLGRHPLAGLAAAYAGVSGGYSANLLIGTVDPLLAGITQEAARLIDPTYEVNPAVNWYFMMVSTFLVTALGTWVTARIVEPRLGTYDPADAEGAVDKTSLDPLSSIERKGLVWAGISSLAVVLGIVWMAGPAVPVLDGLPGWGVMRDPVSNEITPLLRSVVAFIFVAFLVPGVVYGWITGTMRSDRDVIDGMAEAMRSLALYIVLVFFAAQFVAFFKYTELGAILAVLGADLLRAINLDNAAVFVFFIFMCCVVNLMLGSASAQWAVTAPIFVPMLMQIGYSPEVTQAAYRIGDSSTNLITPMMSYFGLILAFGARYDRKLGIGTLIGTMLPYTIFFLIGWSALFYVYVFVLGLPVGPGAPTYYPAGG